MIAWRGELQVPLLEEVVRADAGDDEAAGQEGGRDGVEVPRADGRVEGCAPEAREDGLAVLDLVAGRGLHPGVGDQDPERRQERADPHQPGGHVVEALGDLLAAEEQDAQEGRFEEEGDEPFGRQRRAEDVAHEAGVVRPVGPERELHGDARGHADREGGREQFDPEVGRRLVGGDPALVVAPFREHDHHPHADADGDEDEVIADGERELDACERYCVHCVSATSFAGKQVGRRRLSPSASAVRAHFHYLGGALSIGICVAGHNDPRGAGVTPACEVLSGG